MKLDAELGPIGVRLNSLILLAQRRRRRDANTRSVQSVASLWEGKWTLGAIGKSKIGNGRPWCTEVWLDVKRVNTR